MQALTQASSACNSCLFRNSSTFCSNILYLQILFAEVVQLCEVSSECLCDVVTSSMRVHVRAFPCPVLPAACRRSQSSKSTQLLIKDLDRLIPPFNTLHMNKVLSGSMTLYQTKLFVAHVCISPPTWLNPCIYIHHGEEVGCTDMYTEDVSHRKGENYLGGIWEYCEHGIYTSNFIVL